MSYRILFIRFQIRTGDNNCPVHATQSVQLVKAVFRFHFVIKKFIMLYCLGRFLNWEFSGNSPSALKFF